MKTNNLRNEIKEFLKNFCIEVDENTDTVSVDDCFKYQDVIYYIPDDTSIMTDDDALLADMLLATFKLDI